eukprot:g1307.t1
MIASVLVMSTFNLPLLMAIKTSCYWDIGTGHEGHKLVSCPCHPNKPDETLTCSSKDVYVNNADVGQNGQIMVRNGHLLCACYPETYGGKIKEPLYQKCGDNRAKYPKGTDVTAISNMNCTCLPNILTFDANTNTMKCGDYTVSCSCLT